MEVLNVAGSRASKDPNIYEKTFLIINSVYRLCNVKSDQTTIQLKQPKTVAETVDQIIDELSLGENVTLANYS